MTLENSTSSVRDFGLILIDEAGGPEVTLGGKYWHNVRRHFFKRWHGGGTDWCVS